MLRGLQVNHALCLLAYVLPLHTYHVKNFVLRNPVLQRTSKQLRSRSVVIELAATRVLRTVIGLRNEFYNRHMVKHDLLGPVIERLLSNGDR
jgi:protein phosphatase-4 regulatory subunit 3